MVWFPERTAYYFFGFHPFIPTKTEEISLLRFYPFNNSNIYSASSCAIKASLARSISFASRTAIWPGF